MLASYVLRVVAAEALEGRLVGEVEDVRTGLCWTFRSGDELAVVVRDCQRHASNESEAAPCHTIYPFD